MTDGQVAAHGLERADPKATASSQADSAHRRPRLRWAAADAAVFGSLGLAVIALSFGLSRTGHGGTSATALFWLGFVILLTPITIRLLSEHTSRRDRLVLVGITGALTYGVKVLHDPLMFVMGDEFVHAAAAHHLVSAHSITASFANAGVNVAANYPGMQLIAVSISQVSGLSLFVTGLLVIGVACVMLMLAIYQVVEALTGSSRTSGVAALLFAANSNFLFWGVQFSYQSLALPLFIVLVALIIARAEQLKTSRATTLSILVIGAALTVSHHVTSFAVAVVLWLLTLLSIRKSWRSHRAVGLALLATAAAGAWLLLVAPETRSYLGYTLSQTVGGIRHALSGSGARTPFQSAPGQGGVQAPLAEELVSYLAFALVALGVATALVRSRRLGLLRTPGHILICLGALGFLALYALRLSSGSWETANRGQELLFIAPATVLAVGIVGLLSRPAANRTLRVVCAAGILVAICGGVIQGWEADLLLSQPLEVRADGRTLAPQGLTAARWTIARFGDNAAYIADEASGRELLVEGADNTYFGSTNDVPQLLHDPSFPSWQQAFLADHQIDYVLYDRRQISTDPEAGYYFPTASHPDGGQGYYSLADQLKFADQPMTSSIFSSGDVTVYDVASVRQPPRCQDVGIASAATGITCLAGARKLEFAGDRSTVSFPSWGVRYLGLDVRRERNELLVTARLQLQNYGKQPLPADPAGRDVSLQIGGRPLTPLASVRFRTDNLDGSMLIAPGSSLEGNRSFAVTGTRTVKTIARTGAYLYVQSPTATGGLTEVAVFGLPALPALPAVRPTPGSGRRSPPARPPGPTGGPSAGRGRAAPRPRRRHRAAPRDVAKPQRPARAKSPSRRRTG
jgi:hypothetical protein